MERLTIQKYAAMNRLSIHSVIKKTLSGELPTEVVEVDGKEVSYILIDDNKKPVAPEVSSSVETDEHEIDYKDAYEALHKEYLILQTKYNKLLSQQG